MYPRIVGLLTGKMDLHLGVFDVKNPDAKGRQSSSGITQHSLNSLSDGAESDSSSECASDSSSESDEHEDSEDSEEEYSSDGEQVKLIEEIE